MKYLRWIVHRERRLAVVMGFIDGVLTAMLLAAGRMLGRGMPIDLSVALRVATGALATAGLIFYIGRYAELRAQLVRAEAQLNLTKRGRLATTHIGHKVLFEAIQEAVLSGISSFISALLPLILAAVFPWLPLLSVIVSLFGLGVMGVVLGVAVRGSPFVWAVNLIAGGVLITLIGFWLHLV